MITVPAMTLRPFQPPLYPTKRSILMFRGRSRSRRFQAVLEFSVLGILQPLSLRSFVVSILVLLVASASSGQNDPGRVDLTVLSWNARTPSADIDHILTRRGHGLQLEPLGGNVLEERYLSDHRPVRGRIRVRTTDVRLAID